MINILKFPSIVSRDNYVGHIIHHTSEDMISYYNLVSKIQVTFKIDKEFPDYINYTVTTKDNRMFIIGKFRAFEFDIADNTLQDRAEMK